MSKYNNVNPDHYKVAGRERPDVLAKERMKDTHQEAVRKHAEKKPARKPAARKR